MDDLASTAQRLSIPTPPGPTSSTGASISSLSNLSTTSLEGGEGGDGGRAATPLAAAQPNGFGDTWMCDASSLNGDAGEQGARKMQKTTHGNEHGPRGEAVDKGEALKLAANGDLEGQGGHSPASLTASNLSRVPAADELAPGIRLPGQGGADSAPEDDSGSIPVISADLPVPVATHVGHFGPSGEPVRGVPPELDPRAASFRPQSPGAASVFSVAVQAPGSPKLSIHEAEPSSPGERGFPSSSLGGTAFSSRPSSVRGSSPPPSAGVLAGGSGGAGPSGLSRIPPSYAPSEAGSASSGYSGAAGSGSGMGTAEDAELSLRAAYIERQRMREREAMGGEAGMGGATGMAFAGRTASALPFGLRAEQLAGGFGTSRAGSTAATIGTSSPTQSLSGVSDLPDAVAHSRRNSVESTETLASNYNSGRITSGPGSMVDVVTSTGTGTGSGPATGAGAGAGVISVGPGPGTTSGRKMSRQGSAMGEPELSMGGVAPESVGPEESDVPMVDAGTSSAGVGN